MSKDGLVYDMSSQSEGTPNVFLSKQTLSILASNNGQYSSNQCVIDTSQMSNSNKYMDFKNSRLVIPMLMTLTSEINGGFAPATAATSADYTLGLRNWFGTVINSLSVEYNGTSVVQQTNNIPIWNTFKLMTSLSLDDIKTQGSTIGFAPDSALSVAFMSADSKSGVGTCNNSNLSAPSAVSGAFNAYEPCNDSFRKRQMYWNYNPQGLTSKTTGAGAFSSILSSTSATNLYKSQIFQLQDSSATEAGVMQVAINAVVYLKHLHSFFDNLPLTKGVFMKLTLGLSQPTISFTSTGQVISAVQVNNALGGVSPLQIASADTGQGASTLADGNYVASLAVGTKVHSSAQQRLTGVVSSSLSNDVLLECDSYVFNPVYEQAYLSQPVKQVEYEDIYQYTVKGIGANASFNQLITNGMAGIKTVAAFPFFSSTANGGLSPIESPFDGAGAGTCSPMCHLSNYNVVVAGSNMLENNSQYLYETYCDQLKGFNSVNGDLTDGLTSGLIGQQDFEMNYGYYVTDCSRRLPVEDAVPKSVSIIGKNMSQKEIDLIVFVSYSQKLAIDILTGSRM